MHDITPAFRTGTEIIQERAVGTNRAELAEVPVLFHSIHRNFADASSPGKKVGLHAKRVHDAHVGKCSSHIYRSISFLCWGERVAVPSGGSGGQPVGSDDGLSWN